MRFRDVEWELVFLADCQRCDWPLDETFGEILRQFDRAGVA
jgi:hypothetical protein